MHKQKGPFTISNLKTLKWLDGPYVKPASYGTPGSGVTQQKLSTLLCTELLTISAAITVTDTGGANGGYGALKIYTYPSKKILIIGGIFDVALTAAAGIGATAAVDIALGTAAEATNATLDSTSADVVSKIDAPLTASAGVAVGQLSATAALLDATAGTSYIHLNLGVPDADITASSSITVVGTFRLVYLDLSQGA